MIQILVEGEMRMLCDEALRSESTVCLRERRSTVVLYPSAALTLRIIRTVKRGHG